MSGRYTDLFKKVSVQMPDGSYLPGYKVACSGCARSETFTVNTRQTAAPKLIHDKMRLAGWLISRSGRKFTCPACKAASYSNDPEERLKKVELPAVPAKPQSLEQKPVTNKTSLAPRTPSFREIKTIYDRLDEVFDGTLYSGEYSDAKLAEELDMPRAWVTQAREEAYGKGPVNNEAIEKIARQHEEIREELKAVEAAINDIINKTAALATRAAETKRRLDQLSVAA